MNYQWQSEIFCQYSTNYTDLPETWLETKYLLNLSLDFLVTLGHSVQKPSHCEIKKQEVRGKIRPNETERDALMSIINKDFDAFSATCQTSTSRHSKLRQSLGKIERFKVQINKNKQR